MEIPGHPGVGFLQPQDLERSASADGNTFINEGWFGRFFEVTREGDVVWEYVNPYFGARKEYVNPFAGVRPQAQFNSVQRAYRYSTAEIARAQAAT